MDWYLVCTSDFYYENRIFNISSKQNRDNSYYPYFLLKKQLQEKGCLLNTYDYLPKDNATGYGLLFFEIPADYERICEEHQDVKKLLVLFECEMICPLNWDMKAHEKFDTIFTWNDDIVDGKKYFKINFPNPFPAGISRDVSRKEKLCTLIAGHKRAHSPLDLYVKRLEAIRWFERFHPEEFDLYGMGWDRYVFPNVRFVKFLNRSKTLTRLFAPRFPSYRGQVESKRPVLEKYRFSICYENFRDIPGYITEKIFDCFFAGCVPVYWGANNIFDHVPAGCFIDKRAFASYEALYEYLTAMDEATYLGYLDNIETYLRSEQAYQYSSEYFVETLVGHMLAPGLTKWRP